MAQGFGKKPSSGSSQQDGKAAVMPPAKPGHYPAAPASFTESFFANVLPDDLACLTSEERVRIAASIFHLAQKRNKHEIKIRAFNPSPTADGWTVDHTVLEIINDDMPFLVDSVSGSLHQLGLTIHLVVHPVMQIVRDKDGKLINIAIKDDAETLESKTPLESCIHIQFDHCLDQAFLRSVEEKILAVLNEVRLATEGWPAMRQEMRSIIAEIESPESHIPKSADKDDASAFMRWIDNSNFIYLGYRDINLKQEKGKLVSIQVSHKNGLGILYNPELRLFGGLRDMNAQHKPTLQTYVRQNQLIFVTKTNVISNVHRCVPMDAIFIRHFDKNGEIIGERLFVGLFTSRSYSQSPRDIPFLRHKLEQVITRAGLRPNSHDGKSLVHILNNYPHDELFQISEEELFTNAMGILQLQERSRVALLVRIDPFGRFISCLIYVPRDHYNSTLRSRFQKYLEECYQAKVQDWQIRVDDSQLARFFVSLNLNPEIALPDIKKIEAALREMTRNWSDHLRDALSNSYGEATAIALMRRYGRSFPSTYCDGTEPKNALRDIHHMEKLRAETASDESPVLVDIAMRAKDGRLHLKLFQMRQPLPLSAILPQIENAGLKIEYMGGPYEVRPEGKQQSVFIQEFVGVPARELTGDFTHIKEVFEESFSQIWLGAAENDAFNGLTLRAGLKAREITLLRCLARYLRQLRIPYSHEMMAETFLKHPVVAQKMVALFNMRHNPDLKGNRAQLAAAIEQEIVTILADIKAIEEDRIIRRYLNLIQSSLRSNYFQMDAAGKPKDYISIKFDSRAVDFMPLPKPLYEIFVYSVRTEAVHLRGGKVARGGIRWSDRRDDFRNEILGLMKAQMVKNSVIVPVGSKGGFIVKHPPAEADKMLAEGIACYRIMMCGMLDITDNRAGTKIVPPAQVVRHDNDDPYLVVAADKGTAKFSDIANGISQEYKFWLDDAFASGGSAGYDHKGMGITARGAWEAVKRHFREMGKDIQTTDFTCVGVGDMSGDVFGNGMLLSKHICLIGAFDHRHIFCDPNPDATKSFAERQRLYNLPRSSWADYDAKLISKGGGIFSRSEKAIRLSPEMKKAYGISGDTLSPSELAQAMLKADIELLYFGGIGTYVKASNESNEDVGDRATEALRIDGKDIRAKVIGEGANLGATQRGRIEYALKGGRINTDAIDNSAGVDTSDHEVNIKIAVRKMVDRNEMSIEDRDTLLASMTDDVGDLVLRDNYLQTQALSVSEGRAAEHLGLHVRSMHLLEKSGLLNSAVEFLPDSRQIAEYKQLGRGLTRPELAVMLAYAKIWLYDQLLASDLPDDPFMQSDLVDYFPATLQKKIPAEIVKHQLAREIIATTVTNSVVNRAGTNFVLALTDQTGKDAATVTRAYLIVREAFSLRSIWRAIEMLDNHVAAKIQTSMHGVVRETLDAAVLWFLTETEIPSKLTPAISSYRQGIEMFSAWLTKQGGGVVNERSNLLAQSLIAADVPHDLATQIGSLPTLAASLDVLNLAFTAKIPIPSVAETFFGLGQRLSLDWLIEHTRAVQTQTPWQREAAKAVASDIMATQRRLTETIVKASGKKVLPVDQRLEAWATEHHGALERYDAQIKEWRGVGTVDISILTLAARQLAML